MEATPLEWDDYNYTLDFGKSNQKLFRIPQTRLQRRQSLTEPSSTAKFSTPTSQPDGSNGTEPTSEVFSFNKSVTDRQLIPTNSSAETIIGLVPEGFSVTCKNCTVRGDLDILSGTISARNTVLEVFHLADDDLKDSYVEFIANNIFAHIELEMAWQGASVNVARSAIQFLTLPISGISIPNIASIGLALKVQLVFEATVSKDLQLKYGFQVVVPNNSTAIANLGNVTLSSATGFDKAQFSKLPFEFQADNLTLSLSASLQPEIALDFVVGRGKLATGVGARVFLDIPKYTLGFKPLEGPIDENCTEVRGRPATDAEVLLGSVGNITQVVPSYQIGAGFELVVKDFNDDTGTTASFRPLATTFPAPTACLAFVPGSGLVEATQIASSIYSDIARAASQSLALASAFATANGQENFGKAPDPAAPTQSAAVNGGARVAGNPFTREDVFAFRLALVVLSFVFGAAVLL
ncbi:hypothetical protein ABW20_dc0102293 [Dactylellina cionopaga]|nr:hypothetical protein ABW20_dc0102293 [Dactylellina cionopaga]